MWHETSGRRRACHSPVLSENGSVPLMTLLVVALLFIVLTNALGLRWGADSRDGRDWQPLELRGPCRPRNTPGVIGQPAWQAPACGTRHLDRGAG